MKGIFIVVLIMSAMYSCKKIDYGAPAIKNATLILAAPVEVSLNTQTAICNSSLDLSGGTYTYGFCYSTARNPSIPGLVTTSANYSSGNFSAALENVEYGKKYYIRAFVTNGFATQYSNQDSFLMPLFVYTDTVKNISARSFDVPVYTLPTLADSITERGVCYDTLTQPLITGLKTINTINDTGTIRIHVSDSLKAGRKYYARGYFIANGNVTYGNEVSFTTAGYIGGSGGFIIFDKVDTAGGWRYIEAALDTVTSPGTTWGCSSTSIPGTLTVTGAGLQNSNSIIAACTDTSSAAYICRRLTLKTKNDWYLPSLDEVKALYELKITNVIARSVSLFSSSQADASTFFTIDFLTGVQQQIPKSSTALSVWPVRRF